MRKFACYAAALLLLYSCKKNVSTDQPSGQQPLQAMARTQIDGFIREQLNQSGVFLWQKASDEMIWSALQQSDHIMSVGFKPEYEGDIAGKVHELDISSGDWKAAKDQVLNLILNSEKKTQPGLTLEKMTAFNENVLPVVDVFVYNLETVKLLRASKLVRYAEPMGYEPQGAQAQVPDRSASSSGCGGNNAEAGLVNGSDYTVVAPNALASWNYVYHGVAGAWNKSTGAGTKVFIIDTGASFSQSLLGSSFNNGSSSGRTVEKISTLPSWGLFGLYGSLESANDACGHGTSMAGACAAPRNNLGATVGIAYNCNLVVARASSDVFIDESRESKGVADAYVNAGNRADVRVISMSMGRITSSGQITDAVNFAYNRGKLLFCAAGTSLDWTAGWAGVIFPAWLSNVNAVTGTKDNLTSRCDACHVGSEVDFVVVMEKASNGRKPLSVAQSGNPPSTVGGSSVATASTAGMAALVWSRFPTLTRDQILNKLIVNSSNYPGRSSSFGWGRINVDAATN